MIHDEIHESRRDGVFGGNGDWTSDRRCLAFDVRFAFMLVALVAAVVLAPNDLKAMVSQLTGVFDKGLGRIEALWQDIKSTLDQWGAREMAKTQTNTQTQANSERKEEDARAVVKQQCDQ